MGGCVENHSVVNLGPWNDLGDIRVAKKFRGDTERQIISGPIVTRWENLFSSLIKCRCLSLCSTEQLEIGRTGPKIVFVVCC